LEYSKALSKSKKFGEPFDSETNQGCKSRKLSLTLVRLLRFNTTTGKPQSPFQARSRVHKSGNPDGAMVQVGISQHSDKGYFFQPTIFASISPSTKIAMEIFAPVSAVIKFRTEDGIHHPFKPGQNAS
jgi:hypothetical protein